MILIFIFIQTYVFGVAVSQPRPNTDHSLGPQDERSKAKFYYKNFKMQERSFLNFPYIIKRVYESAYHDCRVACGLDTQGCLSFNAARFPDSTTKLFWCDLLSLEKYNSSSSFIYKEDSVHFRCADASRDAREDTINNPCSPNPCNVSTATCYGGYGLGFKEFKCICPKGFTGQSCTSDIDECATDMNSCSQNQITCMNTVGSYTCICHTGFVFEDNTCKDMDECSSGPDPCSDGKMCVNTIGTYTCKCRQGFIANDAGTCSDVDECALGVDTCKTSNNEVCKNTVGSFTCNCKTGFTRAAGGACVDD